MMLKYRKTHDMRGRLNLFQGIIVALIMFASCTQSAKDNSPDPVRNPQSSVMLEGSWIPGDNLVAGVMIPVGRILALNDSRCAAQIRTR